MADDPLIAKTEEAEEEKSGPVGEREARAASLFDLRRIIGALIGAYGIVLVVLGITQSDADIHKSAGTNVNLWSGLGMMAVGALFLVWAFTRPLGEQLREAEG